MDLIPVDDFSPEILQMLERSREAAGKAAQGLEALGKYQDAARYSGVMEGLAIAARILQGWKISPQ